VIREMTPNEVIQCATRAAASQKGEILPIKYRADEEELRRLTCILQYGEHIVGQDVSAAYVLSGDVMSAKHQRFLDAAIRKIHDIDAEETDAFLASHEILT
jgi:hypothetical protein